MTEWGSPSCSAGACERAADDRVARRTPDALKAARAELALTIVRYDAGVGRPHLPPFRQRRAAGPVEASGSTIRDAAGREYLDAAGGAIVVNVGHGRPEIAAAMADQARRLSYVHGTAFTTESLEAYAREVGPYLPVDDPAIYPVSGGSEAMETALKLARAYHLARGEADRWIVYARWGSYHGNTLGALDLSGRKPMRRPYEGWLGRFRHVSAAYPYRGSYAGADALGTADALAAELDAAFSAAEPGTVAAFVAEPIVGATLGAVVPPDGYWPAIAEVCRRHGVLLIADEVMTGFGRTGRWFGLDHWGVRPDLLVAAKGATSGYWPYGFVAVSGTIHDTIRDRGRFIHGFRTRRWGGRGQVLRIQFDGRSSRPARPGRAAPSLAGTRLGDHRAVGEIRGRGLLVGLELVTDRDSRAPFPRSARVVEAVVRATRERGVLVYAGTGCADGTDGDTILLGPPFIVTDLELERIVDTLADAIEVAVAEAEAAVPG